MFYRFVNFWLMDITASLVVFVSAWYGKIMRRKMNSSEISRDAVFVACVADETKPRYSPSANQRPKACSAPRVLPGFSIIGSNWLMHLAVLSCTVIGRVDLLEPWLRSR